MAFYIQLVDSENNLHWSDVMGGENVQDALDGAHGLANNDPFLEGEGLTFRAYPIDLEAKPAATLVYNPEVI